MPVLPVAKPERKPRVGGIKSVIGDFVHDPRLAITGDPVVWDGPDCAFPLEGTRAGCFDETVPAADKSPDGYSILEGSAPFARYVGVQCTPGDDTDFSGDARALLEAGEDRAVEDQIGLLVASETPANSQDTIAAAIGAVEFAADATYVGAPVILVSRGDVAAGVDGGALAYTDGRLTTTNGNAVVSSAEFPPGRVAAIGWPAVYASDPIVVEATSHRTNQTMAIAERVFAFALDCEFIAVVDLTTP